MGVAGRGTGDERADHEPLHALGTPAGSDDHAAEADFAEEHDSVSVSDDDGGPEGRRDSDSPRGLDGMDSS